MFKDKVVFITGASKGLGKAVALAFGRNQAKVAIAARNIEDLKQTASEIEKSGGICYICPLDVSDEKSIDKAFCDIQEVFDQHVEILVNAAGVSYIGNVSETSSEDWRRVLDINLTGTFLTCRAAIKQMCNNQKGRIINISSVSGKTGQAGASAYCASKAAVISLTQSLAKEVAPFGVRVNAICPGALDTDMFNIDTINVLSEKFNVSADILIKKTLSSIPIKRLILPEEVAEMVLTLSRFDIDIVNGQSINICGGYEVH